MKDWKMKDGCFLLFLYSFSQIKKELYYMDCVGVLLIFIIFIIFMWKKCQTNKEKKMEIDADENPKLRSEKKKENSFEKKEWKNEEK